MVVGLTVVRAARAGTARQGAGFSYLTYLLHYELFTKGLNQVLYGPVPMDVETSLGTSVKRAKATRRHERMTPPEAARPRMLNRMPAAPEHLELPHPRRLLWQSLWSMAESVGLPFGTYVVVTDLVSPDAGLLSGAAVVWMLIAVRKVITGSVTSLLMISALVLSVQTVVAISTGYTWMFEFQFPVGNLAMCVMFARTAPTRKPLVAQLAAEVVALKQPHPSLHRFFQGATWLWAGLFLLATLGLGVMMITEPYKLFLMLSTVVTVGLTVVGAGICALWFFAVIRRLGLRLHFSAA